ncbi:DUF2147 domain-containing protein [Aquimarina sp. BL5]|uniref:DUF2147 domain-containing protein n=1 Tax=Aquimarina sp. BL5 TaxID=1714860 RepID=UPI000E525FD3|nr:DUF2147 domain-containing protein [Aquimarina sp. BL5]AXT49767.1 DUF2147 domain-containing protein [Aquimarina sp. BL5]RKM91145.1 DUF2147 domain-containing protein [Aquimarina sp. BL5]
MRLTLLLLLTCICISSIKPETYIGKWRIEGGSIIEIYKDGDRFFGKINKRAKKPISNLNGLDNKNPNLELRQRQLLGIDILNDLSFEDGELSGGTIYNADSGKTYTVKVWIDSDNTDLCYIRAYKGILFKTFEAKRVKN